MIIYNILLTTFFVALNAFFVAAEFAIVKVRISQIELKIRAGSKLAKLVQYQLINVNAFLSAAQLGITLASLGLGWIGESVVAEIIISLFKFFGFQIDPVFAHKISLPISFATITFLHIVFGEVVPKTIAIQRAEKISLAVAIPTRIFSFIFNPIIWFINFASKIVLKLVGFEPVPKEQNLHSADEIRYLINESSKSGIIDSDEHELFENVFEFSETPIRRIMVPHNKIVAIDINTNSDNIIKKFIEEGYSRLPVYENSLDNILGVIYAKDLLSLMQNRQLIIIHDLIRPVLFVNEDEKIDDLLKKLQKVKIHLAIAVDEFGGTAGLVTLEDILEELVGEIQDEYDEELPAVEKITDNIFNVRASLSIDDANDRLPIPLIESEDYETVGGMVMSFTGRIPELNEELVIDNYKIIILKRSKRNLELLRLEKINNKENNE